MEPPQASHLSWKMTKAICIYNVRNVRNVRKIYEVYKQREPSSDNFCKDMKTLIWKLWKTIRNTYLAEINFRKVVSLYYATLLQVNSNTDILLWIFRNVQSSYFEEDLCSCLVQSNRERFCKNVFWLKVQVEILDQQKKFFNKFCYWIFKNCQEFQKFRKEKCFPEIIFSLSLWLLTAL